MATTIHVDAGTSQWTDAGVLQKHTRTHLLVHPPRSKPEDRAMNPMTALVTAGSIQVLVPQEQYVRPTRVHRRADPRYPTKSSVHGRVNEPVQRNTDILLPGQGINSNKRACALCAAPCGGEPRCLFTSACVVNGVQ